jgi:soluble lytic murein transglycosylase-like protein
MWRPFAAGLFCAYFTFVGFPLFSDFIDAKSKRPPAAAASVANVQPQIQAKAQPTSGQLPLAALAASELPRTSRQLPLAALAASEVLPLRYTEARIDTANLVRAFDPDIYRGGRIGEPMSVDEICEVVEEVAAEHNISSALFARLIWQESRFRNETISRAGAQGMAQFMPATATERGLDDPFDPLEALPASAQFLRSLTDRFGNFGLAAAAYNGGPQRVSDWLAGRGGLPKETRDYVRRITGRDADYWAKARRAKLRPDYSVRHLCALTLIREASAESPRSQHQR